jgi:hypothetical protein
MTHHIGSLDLCTKHAARIMSPTIDLKTLTVLRL